MRVYVTTDNRVAILLAFEEFWELPEEADLASALERSACVEPDSRELMLKIVRRATALSDAVSEIQEDEE